MREFAKSFYTGRNWRNCRDGYMKFKGGLCERCLAMGMYVPGEIVHHRIELTPENINDESITLNYANLELVCRNCHKNIHGAIYGRKKARMRPGWRYVIGTYGAVETVNTPPLPES